MTETLNHPLFISFSTVAFVLLIRFGYKLKAGEEVG